VWATRWGAAAFLSVAAIVLGLAGAQIVIEFLHWMNIIEEYPIKIGPGGISEEMASFSRLMWGLAFAGIVPYLAASYFVAGRMRAWIDKAGYSAAARALARMEAVARLAAIQEVARFAIRREYARTTAQARQMVVHRHILVDGQLVDRPSFRLKPGQLIHVKERSEGMEPFQVAAAGGHVDVLPPVPGYLDVEIDKLHATLLRRPKRSEVPVTCDVQLVVEYYAAR
jgi:hypothetical protein